MTLSTCSCLLFCMEFDSVTWNRCLAFAAERAHDLPPCSQIPHRLPAHHLDPLLSQHQSAAHRCWKQSKHPNPQVKLPQSLTANLPVPGSDPYALKDRLSLITQKKMLVWRLSISKRNQAKELNTDVMSKNILNQPCTFPENRLQACLNVLKCNLFWGFQKSGTKRLEKITSK